MDSRPGAHVENVETCLAGRAQLSPAEPDSWQKPRVVDGFVKIQGRCCENHETRKIHAFSGVSGRCFELAGRPCVFPCFLVGANAEDVDTCLTVGQTGLDEGSGDENFASPGARLSALKCGRSLRSAPNGCVRLPPWCF